MEPTNPYTPPSSAVSEGQPRLAGSTRALLLCLVAVQIGIALMSVPSGFQLARTGEISVLTFFGNVLALCVFAIAGGLVLARRRAAGLLFGTAALLGLFTTIQWRAPFVFTGIAIGIIGALVFLFGWRTRA